MGAQARWWATAGLVASLVLGAAVPVSVSGPVFAAAAEGDVATGGTGEATPGPTDAPSVEPATDRAVEPTLAPTGEPTADSEPTPSASVRASAPDDERMTGLAEVGDDLGDAGAGSELDGGDAEGLGDELGDPGADGDEGELLDIGIMSEEEAEPFLAWSVIEQGSGHPVAGATFTVEANYWQTYWGFDAEIVDCVEAPCVDKTGDRDPAPGAFKVTHVMVGTGTGDGDPIDVGWRYRIRPAELAHDAPERGADHEFRLRLRCA